MCQIIVKEAGKKFNMRKLDKAQGWNDDGYGVTWYENKELKTFKTMDYNRFKAILSTLKSYKAVAHLRNTTRGETCEAQNHPFPIPSGMMFHNGTINGLTCATKGGSDTQALADLINECTYAYIDDITPLLRKMVGTVLNKLVFFETDGEITIVNENLGQEEDGIWYSNDYHERDGTRATQYESKSYVTYVSDGEGGWVTPARLEEIKKEKAMELKKGKKEEKLSKVFVYGTLKEGEGNHANFLKDAKKEGTAQSVGNWAMIGKDMPFPYLLERDQDKGHHIHGEVYSVTKAELSRLNMLEGTPDHYKQTFIYISYMDGRKSENVLTYVKSHVTAHDKARPYISNFVRHNKAAA